MPPVDPVPPASSDEEAILRNVHPPDWENPEPNGPYDLVAIGGGTAGLSAVTSCVEMGGKAALIELKWMGGEGLNVGYVPSKAFIRSSRVGLNVLKAVEFGWTGSERVLPDFATIMARIKKLLARVSSRESAERYRKLGVDIFFGEASFTGRNTVTVGGKTLEFRKAVITTGSHAVRPPVPGLDEAGFLTNMNVFEQNEIPRRMAVIGGGPIGCELAQSYRRLGCEEITMLDSGNHFLAREDPDAADALKRAFEAEGIRMKFRARVIRVGKGPEGKVIHFEADGRADILEVDEILVGAGRAPNVEGLGLEVAGVEYDKAGVKVDDHLRTTNPDVYAAGDVCSMFKFAHMANASARIVVENALLGKLARVSDLVIPWCTYTDPEIAHVGLYERDAAAQGVPLVTLIQPYAEVERAVLTGETEGFVKIHAHEKTGLVLGGTIVARHAGEMISEITTAIVAGMTVEEMADVIHPYPTISESVQRLADSYRRSRTAAARQRTFADRRKEMEGPKEPA